MFELIGEFADKPVQRPVPLRTDLKAIHTLTEEVRRILIENAAGDVSGLRGPGRQPPSRGMGHRFQQHGHVAAAVRWHRLMVVEVPG
ncbi:hypothetical protein E1181_02935 [Saccharopolyspora terrae]|uniref:Uncharacterized protein n=1 Tax=Saccharopolyspora terrae TaxID=2530384 RepID=A0A4R4W2U0_9PSEU|nr:hypothetical protein [Saccharopolyspora terrae]TDD10203.1 hypothetical protein E1181_02935 [Saccharopolyspora terrae]